MEAVLPRKAESKRGNAPSGRAPPWAAGVVLTLASGGVIAALTVAEKQVNAALPNNDLLGSSRARLRRHTPTSRARKKHPAGQPGHPAQLVEVAGAQPLRLDHRPAHPADRSTAYMLSIPRTR